MTILCVTAGATVGTVDQTVGTHPSTFSPNCSGQEQNLLLCDKQSRSGEQCDINIQKIFITCFKSDLVSVPGIQCNMSVSSTLTSVSELPTTTSLASPAHTTTRAYFTDATNSGTDSSTPGTTVGAPRSGEQGPLGTTFTTIIVVAVCIVAALFFFMVVTLAVVRYKCKHSDTESIHYKKRDPVDVNESVLYSELMDVSIKQNQRESSPVYETIVTKSEGTARIPATDTYPVDLKENIAYEASPEDLKENIAYETHLNPMDIQENIAYYEASKKITTEANEAYDEFTSILQSTVD